LSKIVLVITLLFASIAQANGSLNREQLTSILSEAEDYLSVRPSKSLAMLPTNVDLSPLSESQFFRWHITIIRAAVSLNNLPIIEFSIKKLLAHKSSAEFERQIVSILSGVGIWLRKSGYLKQAKQTLFCALTHNKSDKKKVKLLTSLAIVSRHLDQKENAIKAYNLAKNIAQDKKITTLLATIENNLGVLALESDNITKAELHFRNALAMYQLNSNRSGNVLSGINLLQIFLIQNQQQNYQRLSPSITRLTEAFPNETRKSTLFWLKTVFQTRQGLTLNKQILLQLEKSFYNVKDRKLQLSLKKHFAEELKVNVELPKQAYQQKKAPLWLTEISQCDWEKLTHFKLENLQ
jgi:tetratricopeptide (TPR) repeat protein